SRSNVPCSRVRISSASAPSSAVTVSWPSMAIARATSERMESSSSAISTRGMKSSLLPQRDRRPGSGVAGQIPLVEKAYVNIAAFGGWRSQPRLEVGALAGLEHRLLEHRVPGVDLRALRVADGKAQPRQFDRVFGLSDDRAFDDQDRLAVEVSLLILMSLNASPRRLTSSPTIL